MWVVGTLLVFGLVVLSSAGIVDAQKKFGSPYYYVYHQFLFGILPGLVIAYILSRVKYDFWRKMALPILFAALALMALVFVPGVGYGTKGAVRWIAIHGFVFQPAEILKLALIIYFAAWFGSRNDRLKSWAYGAAPFFILLGFVAVLLALQPDIGTLIVVSMIALGMYFVAGVNMKQLFGIFGVALAAMVLLIIVEPYRFNRIKASNCL